MELAWGRNSTPGLSVRGQRSLLERSYLPRDGRWETKWEVGVSVGAWDVGCGMWDV